MTRIGFVNYSLGVGGIEVLLLRLCKALDRTRFDPVVFVVERDGALEAEFGKAGIPVRVVEKRPGADVGLIWRLARCFREDRIGLVHTQNVSGWFYGGIAARLAGIPLLHTEHSSPTYHARRWQAMEWLLSGITEQITVVATDVKDFMIRRQKIAPRKITVIPNGIDCSAFRVDGERSRKIRATLGLTEANLVIGNVARLSPVKDHRTLLEAFAQVRRTIPSARLLIAGDGPLRGELVVRAARLELNGSVRFLGARRDVHELMGVFDLFVLSSEKEAFPMVFLEAMACGLPVVASGVAEGHELVVNGDTARVVEPKNPRRLAAVMCDVLTNREEAARMGQRGRERVKRLFAFDRMVKAYEDAYDCVARGR